MSRSVLIDTTPPAEAQPRVDALLAPFAEMLGAVPDALRLLAVSPPVLENYVANLGHYLHHPTLSGPLLAMIRYLVSATGGCRYCIDLNARMLLQAGFDLDALQRAVDAPEEAPFDARERALLNLAIRAVNRPGELGAAEFDAVRAHGWSDRDLFDAIWHGYGNRAIGNALETFGLHAEGTL